MIKAALMEDSGKTIEATVRMSVRQGQTKD